MYKKASKKRSTLKRGTSWLTKYKPRASAINRLAPGLGRSLKTRLETTLFVVGTANASGVYTAYLNVGSCFDPTGSLSLVQPVGFDQLKALYARYLVTGGYVEAEFCTPAFNTDVAPVYPWAVAMYPSTDSTALTTFQGASSQPYSTEGLVGPEGQHILKMRIPFNTQKIVGSRLPPVAATSGAAVTADPATGSNVVVPIFCQYAGATSSYIVCKYKIVQDVIFDQRIQVVDA